METVTAPTPQSYESGRGDENLVDTELLVELWEELPDIMFGSPGDRRQQGPGVTPVVGPQTPTDWLYEAESTGAPVGPPPPPPLTDSPVPGKQAERQQTNTTETSGATPLIQITDCVSSLSFCITSLYGGHATI